MLEFLRLQIQKHTMINSKPANPDHPILDVIKNRWSPVAYSNEPVAEEKVMSLLEAARWAPSSFNEQPWSYVVGFKGDETHKKLAETLNDGNAWAREVPVLMLSLASLKFSRNDKPNRHAMHDTGCATGFMFLQATGMDLYMHEMAGFDSDKAREFFKISEDYEPAAMIAIGHPGDSDEDSPRERKSVDEMIWKA